MRKNNSHLQQWRRRMAWFYRVKKEQVEEQEPALDSVDKSLNIVAKQNESTQYFDTSLVENLRKGVEK